MILLNSKACFRGEWIFLYAKRYTLYAVFAMIKKYRFVDFAARGQSGFRNHVVSIEEVPLLIEQYQSTECFSTYFFYTDEIFAYMNTHIEKDRPSIAGFPGKLWAPFLPLDIDAVDLEKALDGVRVIGKTLIQEWKIPEGACHFYFSGSKGFHILLDVRLFGKVLPNQHLHQIFSTLRENLMYELPLFDHALVDLTIKDAVRLLRLSNTLHEKSKLYKISLSAEEIFSNTISEILKKAKKPRPLLYTDETGLVSKVSVTAHPRLSKIFKHVRALVRKYTLKPFTYRLSVQSENCRTRFKK
ncbi:MAG: hypothetical protein HYS08_01085 [Chlamydiae bacterium]|nr:hypothetical protein [Chlamydiota bacterium]